MIGGDLRWIGDIREGKDDDTMVLMMNKRVVTVMTIRIGRIQTVIKVVGLLLAQESSFGGNGPSCGTMLIVNKAGG